MTNGDNPNDPANVPIALPELLITALKEIADALTKQTDSLKETNDVLTTTNTALIERNGDVSIVIEQMKTAVPEMTVAVQEMKKVVSEVTRPITRRMWPALIVSGIGGVLIVLVLIMRWTDNILGADYYVPLIIGALLTAAGLLVLVNDDGDD